MIKEAIDSFWENLKERTTNPFLGTLLVVWTIHNWELVYGLFTFDPKTTQQAKFDFIKNYFKNEGFVLNLISVIGITLIVLLGTYALLNLSRLIINCFEKIITPWVYKITDKGSIVLKKDYDSLSLKTRNLEEKLEHEREIKLKIIQERDEYERKLNSPNTEAEIIISEDVAIKRAYQIISKAFTKEEIDSVLKKVYENDVIYDGLPLINEMLKHGIIEIEKKGAGGATYSFTKKGIKFKDIFYYNI